MRLGLEADDLLSTAAAPLAAMCAGTFMGCSEVTARGDGEGSQPNLNQPNSTSKDYFYEKVGKYCLEDCR